MGSFAFRFPTKAAQGGTLGAGRVCRDGGLRMLVVACGVAAEPGDQAPRGAHRLGRPDGEGRASTPFPAGGRDLSSGLLVPSFQHGAGLWGTCPPSWACTCCSTPQVQGSTSPRAFEVGPAQAEPSGLCLGLRSCPLGLWPCRARRGLDGQCCCWLRMSWQDLSCRPSAWPPHPVPSAGGGLWAAPSQSCCGGQGEGCRQGQGEGGR